jgi:predicted Na+-dependent transporter
MPFGLDIKSMVVGALIAYFLVPWILGLLAKKNTAQTGS